MRQLATPPDAPSFFLALAPAERTAVWALRRVVFDAQGCGSPMTSPPWSMAGDLARMAGTFAAVFAGRDQAGLRPLRVNPPGSLGLTKDERRLLNAVAAAQGDDPALLDNYLFKVVADRGCAPAWPTPSPPWPPCWPYRAIGCPAAAGVAAGRRDRPGPGPRRTHTPTPDGVGALVRPTLRRTPGRRSPAAPR